MIKVSGFAFINGQDQKVISYTINEYDDSGNLLKANIRKSTPILDTNEDVNSAIETIKEFILSKEE